MEKNNNLNVKNYTIEENHIGIFDNFFDESLIDSYILHYENMEECGLVRDRRDAFQPHQCQDNSVSIFYSSFHNEITIPYVMKEFVEVFFNECYKLYTQKYSLLEEYSRHGIIDIKIQKTIPGEGYHLWHSENMAMRNRNRLSVFSLYLNDVEEGGETEFLYQKQRFKPIKNRLLIWPSTYTHVHRGNPPISNDKYLLTGWVEYIV